MRRPWPRCSPLARRPLWMIRVGLSARRKSRSCATTRVWTPALRQAQGPALALTAPRSRPGLAAAIAATQRAQATALQVGIEACRLRRERLSRRAELGEDVITAEAPRASSPTPTPCSPSHRESSRCLRGELQRCGGVAFWQFNEPWPAVSWAVIDRAGRPKAAYEMLRRAYQPILIAARFPWRRYAAGDVFRADVWLVNDGPEAWQGCCAEALLDNIVVWTAADVSLPPASAAQIGELVVRLDDAPRILALDLRCGETGLGVQPLRFGCPSARPPAAPCPGDPRVGRTIVGNGLTYCWL